MKKGNNRKQVLTYDGKKFDNGLPDMKWKKWWGKRIMWLSLLGMGIKTGAKLYSDKQKI